ncbi:uncharacterized protein LOC108266026 isoform X2 [Ictalurus punctatus]|uniref:Uncharacterized protein LOC108266026 isoform X2 n=1 Tax=Ictalurus punctatus TaxID=7998 RepID=A0A9F7RAB8_ICTPU|nr:uncharacterized protein LOC108266026 isoform X2 [Ictalurus punctatus]
MPLPITLNSRLAYRLLPRESWLCWFLLLRLRMACLPCLLAAFLFLLVGCRLTSALYCSVEHNTTCDSMGKATLDTSAFYEKCIHCSDCDWSLRRKDDSFIEEIKPSLHVAINCSFPEILLKVHCFSPKYEFRACFKFFNQTKGETGTESIKEASNHRIRNFVIIPVVLFLVVLVVLAIMRKRKRMNNDILS